MEMWLRIMHSFFCNTLGKAGEPVELAKRYLPLFDLNLGWLLPAVIGFVIGMAIHLSRRGRAK